MHSLQFQNIGFAYDDVSLIEDLNFIFESGKSYCILGSSGSGKTTVLRLIAGLEIPHKGQILMNNQVISQQNELLIPPHKREVGFVFQDLALWPHFRVYDNIAFGLKERKAQNIEQRVMELLDLFGITDQAQKYPHQLSGGQKQMVAISRALVLQPKILLLDEPMANIDIQIKEQILEHLYKIQKQLAFTLIYVTHDHRDAVFSEQIVIMNKGKIEVAGTLNAIRNSTNEYVKSFIKI
ncbi:MAG: ABC transporter ATP-binding protein [Bacteroidetes bacterium]|nr:MAG: ABC transporter ATP-binding protein [Bacteroidota bacterium]